MADHSRAIELAPDIATGWNNRAVDRKRMNDYRGALDDLNQAVALDPTEPNAWMNRGNVKLALGLEETKQGWSPALIGFCFNLIVTGLLGLALEKAPLPSAPPAAYSRPLDVHALFGVQVCACVRAHTHARGFACL